MMLTARLFKESGTWWGVECPIAGVYTQGRSRRHAVAMLADAFESLIEQPGFEVTVSELGDDELLVEASDPGALVAYVLRYQREVHHLTLAQVAKRLGATSRNAYARYEQGRAAPSMDKLAELLRVVAPDAVLVLTERKPPRSAPGRPGSTAGKRRAG